MFKGISFICLIIFCFAANAVPGSIVVGSLTTNPAANAVLATTGALSSGGATSAHYLLSVTCSGTAAFTCAFQVMNGATPLQTFYLQAPAGTTTEWSPRVSFSIPNGDNLRVITPTSVTGSVQATIIYAIDVTD